MTRTTPRSARGGFTLIEVAVATAIVGVGVVAMMTSLAANTRTNHAGQSLTHAVFLAQEIREWTLKLPFSDPDPGDAGNPPGPDGSDPQDFVDDLDDLMDVTYSPSRDGLGNTITHMPEWSQTISLTWRDPDSLTTVVSPGTSELVYVQVEISHQGRTALTTGWLVSRRG